MSDLPIPASAHRSRFVRQVIIETCFSSYRRGILDQHLETGICCGPVAISTNEFRHELSWLEARGLVEQDSSDGFRHWRLTHQGMSFYNLGLPWAQVEKLD